MLEIEIFIAKLGCLVVAACEVCTHMMDVSLTTLLILPPRLSTLVLLLLLLKFLTRKRGVANVEDNG